MTINCQQELKKHHRTAAVTHRYGSRTRISASEPLQKPQRWLCTLHGLHYCHIGVVQHEFVTLINHTKSYRLQHSACSTYYDDRLHAKTMRFYCVSATAIFVLHKHSKRQREAWIRYRPLKSCPSTFMLPVENLHICVWHLLFWRR